MDAVVVVKDDGGPSTLTGLLGFAALVYYVLIWYISLTGLRQARQLFGQNDNVTTTTTKQQRRSPGLPLRYPAGEVPLSPPPPPSRDAFAGTMESYDASSAANGAATHSSPASGIQGGVSILRPLAGLDHNLASNLASAFEQRYPKHLFEVILSVRDEHDQALRVAQTVCARYADVQSTIIVGDEDCGVNPKIRNLVRPFAAAKFDIVWVLDAQVNVSPFALSRGVHALLGKARTPEPRWMQRKAHGDGRVGLAHHVPLGVTPDPRSFGSHVEAIFLSTNHAKMYLAINSFSIDSCVMGKSNMYRKSDLACVPDSFFNVGDQGTRGEAGAIGSVAFEQPIGRRHSLHDERGGHLDASSSSGLVSKGSARPLARFGIFLAEDNMLATSLWREPLNLAHTLIAKDVARTSVGEVKSIVDYWHRRVRWIRVRRHMVPAATYVEPFTESIVCGAIATTALLSCWLKWLGIVDGTSAGRNVLGATFFLLHLLFWHIVDFLVLANVQRAGQDDVTNGHTSPLIDFDDAQSVLWFRLAWLCRELLALPIWTAALCGNKVTWRGRRFKILSDSRAAHVETPRRPAAWGTAGYESVPEHA